MGLRRNLKKQRTPCLSRIGLATLLSMLVIVPQASADQLNGLAAVLDRYAVKQIMATTVPNDNRAGRDWWAMLMAKRYQPIELQDAAVEPNVNLAFDGSSVLIESGDQRVALGASEQAQINIIGAKIDRLPKKPQMILTWIPIVSDTRVIDLTNRGTLDLTLEQGGVVIGELR